MTAAVTVQQDQAALRRLLDHLPAVVWSVDADLRYTWSGGAGLAGAGWQPGQVVGSTLEDFLADSQGVRAKIIAAHRQSLSGQSVSYETDFGGHFYRCHLEPLRDPDGRITGVVGVAYDLTESRRATEALRVKEDELRQAQRMEAVARLAGGIAHDFNNLLTAISGYAHVILAGLAPDDGRRKDLGQIVTAAQKATALTQQLMALGRRQTLSPQILDLGAVVSGVEPVLRRLLGQGGELIVKTAPGLAQISADQGQVEQAIMNLVAFARDRTPDGARVAIELSNGDSPDGREDSWVRLRLGDDGPGLGTAARDKMFEPFAVDGVSETDAGLRLASVHAAVTRMQGRISVDSPQDRGAVFEVLLPQAAVPGRMRPAHSTVPGPRQEAAGPETVLLVEDETAVRELVLAALREQGYRVLEADSVQAALEIGESFAGRIDLLLADVVMPQMNGPQVAARLAPLRPEMRILYMSGHADDAIVHRGVLSAGQALVAKPFTMARLVHEVRRALRNP